MKRNTSLAINMLLTYLVLLYLVQAHVLDTNSTSTIYTLGPVERAENNVTFTLDTVREAGSRAVGNVTVVTESPEESSSLFLVKAVFSEQGKCTSPMVYDKQRERCVKRRSFADDGNPIWRRKRR